MKFNSLAHSDDLDMQLRLITVVAAPATMGGGWLGPIWGPPGWAHRRCRCWLWRRGNRGGPTGQPAAERGARGRLDQRADGLFRTLVRSGRCGQGQSARVDDADRHRHAAPRRGVPLRSVLEHSGNGADLANFDSGKGLELIPTTSSEVLFNLPPYEERTNKKPAEGFGDWPVLTVKQRFISANAENGDYIVTGFLGVQAPIGVAAFTNHAWMITPTLAAGKGWGTSTSRPPSARRCP